METRTTTVNYHATTNDIFDVRLDREFEDPYAAIHIGDEYYTSFITIFTPRGVNRAKDYLSGLRDAINGAIAKLEDIDSKEAE